jgi:3-keto-5-aminohexanoate cleavage enzyme
VVSKKIVILAALTGGTQVDRDGAKVPTTPQEIADAAYACYREGASVVHIHARDEQNQPTGDLKVFSEIISRIREKCDVLIQTTNGIGSRRDAGGNLLRPTEEERMALLTIEPRQDLFSIGGGSWDFFHPGVPNQNRFSFVNSEDFLRKTIPTVMKTGGALEFEITEPSFLQKFRRLGDEGVFNPTKDRFWLDYCFGFGGMPANVRAFSYVVDEGQRLFPGARWQVLATHTDQFAMNTIGLLSGCDIVRVGFEDNLHLPDGRVAKHNDELVVAMARIAQLHGRDPATVAEARQVFGLAA